MRIDRYLVPMACGLGLLWIGSANVGAQAGGAKNAAKGAAKPVPGGSKITTFGGKSKSAADKNKITTLIYVELVTGEEGVGIKAQRWTQIFEKLDVTLTIRRGRPKDKPGVTQKTTGDTTRQVYILGQLEPTGKIVFNDRVFTEGDSDKIAAWLDELREFGAQGTPEGQPAWGLTKQQFGELFETLGTPLAADTLGDEFTDALKKFQLTGTLQVRLTESAATLLKSRDESKSQQSLQGISRGTALAILLSEQGLGFRPRRRQDGTIELSVAPISELNKPWPVGWPRKESGPATAPKLFKFYPIDLHDIELDAVLEAAAQVLEVPILVDRGALAAKDIDLSQVKVSQKPKRTTWSLALSSLLFQARTKFELLIDEAGHPFLWVTPADIDTPRRPQDD
ncbi:MAG: hypothetical protein EXS05_15555 [Planctomycetaceae bacterium]|nr:hypothetical protein [Planctomycetaceae bacterium]